MIWGIMPVRAGSQRLPRKNVLPFCGRPLMAWTIVQMRCCELIDTVLVTTDDEEMAEIAREYGAVVHMREDPAESTLEAGGGIPVVAALRKYKAKMDDSVVSIFCTAPLRKPDDLTRLVRKHLECGGVVVSQVALKELILNEKTGSDTYRNFLIYKSPRDWEPDLPVFLDGTAGSLSINSVRAYYEGFKATGGGDVHSLEMRYYSPREYHFIEIEEWQRFDIDRRLDVELCEYFFEKKGLRKYWDEKAKEIRDRNKGHHHKNCVETAGN